MEWTREQAAVVAHAIDGTAQSIPAVCGQLAIPESDDAEGQLGQLGIECCIGCDWWFKASELNEDYVCFDCR